MATIYFLRGRAEADFLGFFEDVVSPVLQGSGAVVLASFISDHSPNNFPRLALREGENVFIFFSGFGDLAAYHQHMTALGKNRQWRSEVSRALMQHIRQPSQILRLSPTSRSQLRA